MDPELHLEPQPQRTPFATVTTSYIRLKLDLTRTAGLILDVAAVQTRGHMVRPNGDWGGSWWCSVPGVAAMLGVSPRTVQRALRELAEGGLVLFIQTPRGYRLSLSALVKRALAEGSVDGEAPGGVTKLSPTRKETLGLIVALGSDSRSEVFRTKKNPERTPRARPDTPRAPPQERGLEDLVGTLLARLEVRMGERSGGGPIGALRRAQAVARHHPIALLEFHRLGFDLSLGEYQGYLEAVEAGRFDHPEPGERQGKLKTWLRYLEHGREGDPFPAWANQAREPCQPRRKG